MKSFVQTDPDILGGTLCFAGTRVPVALFFENLEAGYGFGYFLSQFPTVQEEHVRHLLDKLKQHCLGTGVDV